MCGANYVDTLESGELEAQRKRNFVMINYGNLRIYFTGGTKGYGRKVSYQLVRNNEI